MTLIRLLRSISRNFISFIDYYRRQSLVDCQLSKWETGQFRNQVPMIYFLKNNGSLSEEGFLEFSSNPPYTQLQNLINTKQSRIKKYLLIINT